MPESSLLLDDLVSEEFVWLQFVGTRSFPLVQRRPVPQAELVLIQVLFDFLSIDT